MSNIIDISEYFEYSVEELICLMCMYRFISARQSHICLKDLPCLCGEVGFIISTGCVNILKNNNNADIIQFKAMERTIEDGSKQINLEEERGYK